MVDCLEHSVWKEAEKILALEVWLGMFGVTGAVAQETSQITL